MTPYSGQCPTTSNSQAQTDHTFQHPLALLMPAPCYAFNAAKCATQQTEGHAKVIVAYTLSWAYAPSYCNPTHITFSTMPPPKASLLISHSPPCPRLRHPCTYHTPHHAPTKGSPARITLPTILPATPSQHIKPTAFVHQASCVRSLWRDLCLNASMESFNASGETCLDAALWIVLPQCLWRGLPQ